MTLRYVDAVNGSDSNDGLSVGNAFLTMNKAEDVPIAAADIVHVATGTYREKLTCDVSGTSGNIITYIADWTGEIFGNAGGKVRVTGSDNDTTRTRDNCIDINSRSFRTFRGFTLDMADAHCIEVNSASVVTDVIIEDCFIQEAGTANERSGMLIGGNGDHTDITIRRCVFTQLSYAIRVITDVAYADSNILIENCLMYGIRSDGIRFENTGGNTVKNCVIVGMGDDGIDVAITAGTGAGQFTTVENCIITNCDGSGVEANVTGDIIENFNSLTRNGSNRQNVATGANSNTNPPLFSTMSMLLGFNLTQQNHPFGLSDFSSLRALAGNAETTDDLFGMLRPTVSGKKSWGSIQYTDVERDTGTTHGSSTASLKIADAGRYQLIPIYAPNSEITITCQVEFEANYAGTKPSMRVLQPGQSASSDTAVGSGSFEELSITLTPSATPPYVIIEFVSENTATSGNYDVFFDTLIVDGRTINLDDWITDRKPLLREETSGGSSSGVRNPFRGPIG